MSKLSDHDLTVLVEAAASGAVESRAAHHGGPGWDAMDSGDKNAVREHALPFIFHGTKALAGLGYRKPRTVTTAQEQDALPVGSLLLDVDGDVCQRFRTGWRATINEANDDPWLTDTLEVDLPATVLHEGAQP